jgi:transcriptional regulator with XRE-family HTH domain
MSKRLPSLLTKAREARGLNQSEAARLLGVTQPAVSQWEAGTTVPSLSRLREIATRYGADIGPLTTAWMRLQAERPPRRKEAV